MFLVGERYNGKAVFDALVAPKDRMVRDRMDYWLSGGVKDAYFHGWPQNSEYRHCFCFKWEENRVHQRFYGFLCNPDKDDLRLQMCALVSHDTKTSEDTDFTILGEINRLRSDSKILESIQEWLKQRKAAKVKHPARVN